MATLVLKLRERELQRVPLTKSPTVIGRDVKCDVVIDNPSVSRRHASIEFRRGEGFVIFDVDSANGLFHGGKQVSFRALAEGDEIQIGKFTLSYTSAGGPPTNQIRYVAPNDGESPEEMFQSDTMLLPPEYLGKLRDVVHQRDSERIHRAEIETRLQSQSRTFRTLLILLGALIAALAAAIFVLLAV